MAGKTAAKQAELVETASEEKQAPTKEFFFANPSGNMQRVGRGEARRLLTIPGMRLVKDAELIAKFKKNPNQTIGNTVVEPVVLLDADDEAGLDAILDGEA